MVRRSIITSYRPQCLNVQGDLTNGRALGLLRGEGVVSGQAVVEPLKEFPALWENPSMEMGASFLMAVSDCRGLDLS